MMRGWVVGGGERKKIASESKDHFDVSHHHWFLFFIDVYAMSLFFGNFKHGVCDVIIMHFV